MDIKIHQSKIKGCDDSFFYDGLIAETKKLSLFAVGEIRITDKEGNIVHDGCKEQGDGITIKNDKDLEQVDGENYIWNMNNWFEIIDNKDGDDLGAVWYSYDETLEILKKES